MHRLHDLSELPEDLGPCVVTVGNFDGVHRGHQEVLGMVRDRAREEGARSVVLTFDPLNLRRGRRRTDRGEP